MRDLRMYSQAWLRHVQQWGAGSIIASVQRGVLDLGSGNTTNTATINAVDTSRSVTFNNGLHDSPGSAAVSQVNVRLALTNSTTLTVTSFQSAGAGRNTDWQVIQFIPGVLKSIQRGTLAVTTSTTGTATITSVNTSRSLLSHLSFSNEYTGAAVAGNGMGYITLTNATTITFNGLGGITRTVGYEVAEFNG